MPNPARNRLARESSPYLVQHAENPVDWYPWGSEALTKARAENKPILLSVGYSACHWCHVMAHECFEDPAIAKVMNDNFVNVKVDREERPDIDEVYQRVTQLITGAGGWPLTVFLAPDLRPIYGGTYFPPEPRHGRPSFTQLMAGVLEAYRNRPGEAEKSASQLVEHMNIFDRLAPGTDLPARDLAQRTAQILESNFDVENGGFGRAPKFPMVADHLLLLAHYEASGDRKALDMVLYSLQKMAAGGICDQLGGGFHRYSTDPEWLAPHFEKMLYDNALIPRVYLEAFRITGDPQYTRPVHDTLAYLLREMHDPQGGFYATQDADSEGVEGKFFVWTLREVHEILGLERAEAFAEVYDVTERGNWEHTNILRVVQDPRSVAKARNLDPAELLIRLEEDRKKLLKEREKRVKPGRDDKIIAAWNGLAMSLFALAGSTLEHPPYVDVAQGIAEFALSGLSPGGELKRIYQHGEAKIDPFLDDYAYLAVGLLDLHRASGDGRWLAAARGLLDRIRADFMDAASGAMYLTSARSEALPARPVSGADQMLPSPAGAAIQGFLRLATLTGESAYRELAEKSFRAYRGGMEEQPTAYAGIQLALDRYWRGETSCVIAGPLNGATSTLAQAARRLLRSDDAVVLVERAAGVATHLVEGKTVVDGQSAAFLCSGMSCQPPAHTPAELATRLHDFER